MIKLITDSTSYIPKELLKKYDIKVVSLSVAFDDEIYIENEISNEEFYNILDEYKKIPNSSQPSLENMQSAFENEVKNGNSVIGIFLSSEMSGTYSSANMVKNMILEKYKDAKIEIIDSKSNSMQLGFAVLSAAKAIEKGKDFNEVILEVKKNILRSKFVFMPYTLEYLKMGGRIGNAAMLLGEFLKIKPILTVKDGVTTTLMKVRTMKKAILKLVEIFEEDIKNFGFSDAIIHHINSEEEARKLANLIEKKVNKKIDIVPIGPVIGTHVGPGSIGIVYVTKEELNEI